MANFAPAGIVRIGRVPFDNSYAHTMTFASASSQASFFSSVCTQSLEEGSYTYVRMNNSIKVAFNAERLYTYNYIMYKNRNYGDKWFYAFITGVNYVNERTTELVVELDVMQTWYFDYRLEQCFVEREHVNDDTIGANLMAEPAFQQLEVATKYKKVPIGEIICIVQASAYPIDELGNPNYKNGIAIRNCGTSIHSGVVQGSKFYGFTLYDAGAEQLNYYITKMNELGAADAITAIFMFPRKFANVPQTGELTGYELRGSYSTDETVINVSPPATLDGYVPKNKKLFTYPYNYVKCLAGNQSMVWKYELWGDRDYSSKQLLLNLPVTSQSTLYVTPKVYGAAGGDDTYDAYENYEYSLTTPYSVLGGYSYSQALNWWAYNQSGYVINTVGATVDAMAGIVSGMGGAANPRQAANAGFGSLSSYFGTLANNMNNLYTASLQPNVSRGATSQNADYSTGRLSNVTVMCMTLQRDFAKRMDGFMSMYGYQVDALKTPNRTGRRSWNYVKCANSDFHGNVPAEHMSMINGIYNAGITFWHTSDIGNYSLDNSII